VSSIGLKQKMSDKDLKVAVPFDRIRSTCFLPDFRSMHNEITCMSIRSEIC
jgi:hypothetical protein